MLNMLETNVQGHSKPFTLLLILNFGFWILENCWYKNWFLKALLSSLTAFSTGSFCKLKIFSKQSCPAWLHIFFKSKGSHWKFYSMFWELILKAIFYFLKQKIITQKYIWWFFFLNRKQFLKSSFWKYGILWEHI